VIAAQHARRVRACRARAHALRAARTHARAARRIPLLLATCYLPRLYLYLSMVVAYPPSLPAPAGGLAFTAACAFSGGLVLPMPTYSAPRACLCAHMTSTCLPSYSHLYLSRLMSLTSATGYLPVMFLPCHIPSSVIGRAFLHTTIPDCHLPAIPPASPCRLTWLYTPHCVPSSPAPTCSHFGLCPPTCQLTCHHPHIFAKKERDIPHLRCINRLRATHRARAAHNARIKHATT